MTETAPSWTIEHCELADLQPIVKAAMRDGVKVHDTAQTHWFRAVTDTGAILGCAAVIEVGQPGGGKARLKATWTSPTARGMGIGSALIDACLDYARDPLFANRIEVISSHPDTFRRLGWQETGQRNGYVVLARGL